MTRRVQPELQAETIAGPDAVILVAPTSPWSPETPNVPNVVPDPPAAEVVELERVDEDTLIERSDLGEGACTLIAAGDEVPAKLAGLPRRPAQ